MDTKKKADQGAGNEQAWYVLRTYPGLEKKAKTNLENRLRAKSLETRVIQILIPLEEKGGEKPAVSSFLLLRMKMDAGVWSVVRNTPGVTGFVGMGNTPTPFYCAVWKEIPLLRFAN